MIDWFTVIAQIVNFLILVALLRFFLYGRIVAAMEKRQQEVASRWNQAQQQREKTEQQLNAAHEKNRQLDEQREQLLAQMRDEVELHRQKLTAKVRGEVDELHQRWSDAIQEETESFLNDLRRRASEEVCAIARRALADLASADLEQQIVQRFLRKIEGLENGERREIRASLESGAREAVVQTSYDLSDDLKSAITKTLRERLVEDLEIKFERSGLLCGIALQTDAHKLAWDLHDYLLSLEQELQQALDEETVTRKLPQQESAGAER